MLTALLSAIHPIHPIHKRDIAIQRYSDKKRYIVSDVSPPLSTLCLRRSPAYRLREAGVSEASARDLARQPAPVPEDPDRAFDAPESD